MGLARLIERAAPAPFIGAPAATNGGINYIPADGFTAGRAVPPDYWTEGANAVATGVGPMPATGELATLSLSAAWRCMNILTSGIGALEIYAYNDIESEERLHPHPKILADPWPVITDVEWRNMVVGSLVMHGNAYLIPYDEDPRTGYPRQLPIIHPERVYPEVLNSGRVIYWVDETRLTEADLLHIRGYCIPGSPVGLGVVEAQRRGIQLARAMESYQLGSMVTSAVPPVVIRVNRPELSQTQADDIQLRWMQRHGLAQRVPAVIPTSMEVTPIAWSPEDQQFLESKQYMAVEMCWWFGIDPRLLSLAASGQSLTYANVETTYVDLQRMSFMPWTSRIEAALSRVFPRHIKTRFDFSPILRTTLQDRYSAYATGIEGGWLTVNEVRALENLPPLPGGDEAVQPAAEQAPPADAIEADSTDMEA